MNKELPLITIVLPVYNAARYLEQCVASLLAQTYERIEIIAIDDLSSDDSFQIIQRLKKDDNRIRAYRNKKRYGLATLFNRALSRANGSFIAFVDPQDVAHKDMVRRQLKFLSEHNKVAAVGTQCYYIDEHNKKVGKSEFPQEHEVICQSLFSGFSFQFQSVMVNKLLLPKDLLRFRSGKYPFIFYDVFMNLIKYAQVANLAYPLYYRRKIEETVTHTKQLFLAHFKLWLKSFALYDYRPSIRSLFLPLIKQN